MTVSYKDFAKYADDTLNLFHALVYCRENKAESLTFPKGVYNFSEEYAFEAPLRISNHGLNGFKRIAFLLDGMSGFTVDGGGSTFVFDSIMTMFAVTGCEGVTLKNFTVKMPEIPYPEGVVTAVGEGYFDVVFNHSEEVVLNVGECVVMNRGVAEHVWSNIEFDCRTHEIAYGTSDMTLGTPWSELKKEKTGRNVYRIYGAKRTPPVGNVLVLITGKRYAASIFLMDCKDTLIQNVTFNSCVGMGVIAQTCHNVTVADCRVTASEGKWMSISADATHFVACTGLITLRDCLFEHQLDDALNIHGIYTRVVASEAGRCYVKYMHGESKGINTLRAGDSVCAMNVRSLMPSLYLTVRAAREINSEITELEFEENETVPVGDNIENLTRRADLYMTRCTVRNNRARGMLIATGGRAVIEDCDFHTSGVAILFESNGSYWFESGATTDVKISGNRFDGCKYAGWGNGVISVEPREVELPDRYYHGRIEISGNSFNGCHEDIAYVNNAAEFVFADNTIEASPAAVHLSHTGVAQIQEGVEIK